LTEDGVDLDESRDFDEETEDEEDEVEKDDEDEDEEEEEETPILASTTRNTQKDMRQRR
jgi:hypothetical protein